MIVRVPREQESTSSSSLVLAVQSYCSCQPTWRLRPWPLDMCASRMQAPVSLADDGHLVRGEHKSHRRDEVRQQGQDITPPQPAFEGTIDTVVQRIVSGLTLYTECSHSAEISPQIDGIGREYGVRLSHRERIPYFCLSACTAAGTYTSCSGSRL